MRLVDFQLRVSYTQPVESRKANAQLLPASEAVRWRLPQARVDAPFRKLLITLSPTHQQGAWRQLNVLEVSRYVDDRFLLDAEPEAIRSWLGPIVSEAVSAAEKVSACDLTPVRTFVKEVLSTRPPYVLDPHLHKTDPRTQTRYSLIYRISPSETVAVVRRDSVDGSDEEVPLARAEGPYPPEMLLPARRLLLTDEEVVVVDRAGTRLGALPLDPTSGEIESR